LALILAAWGCQSTPAPTDEAPAPDVQQVAEASPDALLAAARSARGARASRLFLEAAERLLDADPAAAAEALAATDPTDLDEDDTARFLLTRARLAILEGLSGATERFAEARADLAAVADDRLDDPLAVALVRAELMAATGAERAAAEYLMDYRPAAPDAGIRQRQSDAIWERLAEVPPLVVVDAERGASGVRRGWWQLKAMMFQSFTLAEQQRRLAAWRDSRPDHPATRHPPAALASLAGAPPVTRVGLLLPLSGNLSRAGRAVRDAFVATYLSHREEVGFDVIVYDTAAEPLPALYERALVDGADLLIGPLAKEAVSQMNTLNPEVPVLALNYLGDEELPAANLVQLGLAIEDEAATLSAWLTDERTERLLLLHNDEDWARRARATVASSWTGALTVQPLEDIRTVTESVGVAMHVAASETRREELEAVLGTSLEFLPRARGDVDAIVALVTQLEASALVPALKFHFADQIPVYATSQTVRGASPERLRDLAGFRVSELPWFALETPSYRALDDAFALAGSPFAALYALGVDAFRLAERLPLVLDGSMTELLGSTGELSFTPSGRVQRRLARAEVRAGRVQVPGTVGR